jgi:hypothetical protein
MRAFRALGLNEPRSHMVVMAAVFCALGVTLLLQPQRYAHTPSYANLLDIAPQYVWGLIYLAAATLKVISIAQYSRRLVVVVTHTVGITLVSVWLAAFIVRWLTDTGTTIVNVCSWSVFLYLVIRSALMVDEHISAGE